MALEEIALFASAAKELAQYYSKLKEAKEAKRTSNEDRLTELADALNLSLIGETTVADGLAAVIEVFRISGTDTGRRIISICRGELSGYLVQDDVVEAGALFPTRGGPVTFFKVDYVGSRHEAEEIYNGYLLASVNRVTDMLLEQSHFDWVRFSACDSIGAEAADIDNKDQLMMDSHGGQQTYYVKRTVIRQLVREWRGLMVRTEEEIRQLRERDE